MQAATPPAGTTEIRAAHRFDLAALERYMAEHLPRFSGPLAVRQFEGGQSNPTFHVAAADQAYVLRKKPPGKLLPSAHAVDREYRILRALAGSAVPVPHTRLFCADAAVIGTEFYLMDYVPGRIFADPLLPGMAAAERRAIYDSMNATLAELHRFDWRAAGLADFGRSENYVARQTCSRTSSSWSSSCATSGRRRTSCTSSRPNRHQARSLRNIPLPNRGRASNFLEEVLYWKA